MPGVHLMGNGYRTVLGLFCQTTAWFTGPVTCICSNPHVQSEVLDYGGLQLLCGFIGSGEPELVQRRGLFALSALLRGNTQPQLAFVQECRGLMQLGLDFQQRTMPTQLKIVTLLTDLLHEQVCIY